MLGIKEKNRKIRYFILTGVFLIAGFLFSSAVLAQTNDNLGLTSQFASTAGLGTTDIRVIIANIIRVVLGLLGVIAVSLTLYGGFVWMTAGGNEEKVKKAKRILRDALIGLLIILVSFSITQFILGQLLVGGGLVAPGGVGGPGGSALGAGPIESHYPGRNATGIPRNTNIIITFKEKIIKGEIIDANNNITDKIKICELEKCRTGVYITNVGASITEDQKTFVFDPADLLGSADKSMSYKVIVDGSITKVSGRPLFLGQYEWQFEVSTIIDVTPPTVTSVIPFPASTNPRNTIVQINFSEGVNPITASGSSANLTNITVKYGSTVVAGKYMISNQYKTVEFVSNEECKDAAGNILQNSCGGSVYCLPGNQEFIVLIKAASIGSEAPGAVVPPDGIVDLANNSLDGNNNGKAVGPVSVYDFGLPNDTLNKTKGDSVTFKFRTNNTIDLVPPEITSVIPAIGAGTAQGEKGVSPAKTIKIAFSKYIMSSSLKPDGSYPFTGTGRGGICRTTKSISCEKDADCPSGETCDEPFEYVTLVQPEPPSTITAEAAKDVWKSNNWVGYWLGKDEEGGKSIGKINHGQLLEFSDYSVRVGSGVKDINQNCFYPSKGPGCPTPWEAGPPPEGGYPSCEATP